MVTLVPPESVVALVSRSGRHLQRYNKGRRLVVGGNLRKRRKGSCRCFQVEKRFKTSKLEANVLKNTTVVFPQDIIRDFFMNWRRPSSFSGRLIACTRCDKEPVIDEVLRLLVNQGKILLCIPYRYKIRKQNCSDTEEELEVLVISSQKKEKGVLFPKGGWELDESIKEAASRETLEEAGVRGIVECELGKWRFKSKSQDTYHEGYMFPLLVQEQLDFWPEKNVRQRIWMSVAEAKEACQHWWMKEALDVLVNRLMSQQQRRNNNV